MYGIYLRILKVPTQRTLHSTQEVGLFMVLVFHILYLSTATQNNSLVCAVMFLFG